MAHEVLFIAGSPSPASRSSAVARAVADEVEIAGYAPRQISLLDFDPADLLLGRTQAPAVARLIDAARAAAGIVVSSPTYKASYSGALKTVVDLIPPDALADKPALGIATTRLDSHGALVEEAYRALFRFFSAHPAHTVVAVDAEIAVHESRVTLSPSAEQRIRGAAAAFVAALARYGSAPKLA
jgi:FMN reductase